MNFSGFSKMIFWTIKWCYWSILGKLEYEWGSGNLIRAFEKCIIFFSFLSFFPDFDVLFILQLFGFLFHFIMWYFIIFSHFISRLFSDILSISIDFYWLFFCFLKLGIEWAITCFVCNRLWKLQFRELLMISIIQAPISHITSVRQNWPRLESFMTRYYRYHTFIHFSAWS